MPASVTLVPFSSTDVAALRWLKAADAPAVFHLSSGDLPLAEIRWTDRGTSLAHAETASDRWTLQRGGFLDSHVTLRTIDGSTELARISIRMLHHEIAFARGPAFRFRRGDPRVTGILVPSWKVTREDETELVHIEPVREGRHLTGGAVLVSPEGAKTPELAPLLVLTWFFIGLAWFEDEVAVPVETLDKV